MKKELIEQNAKVYIKMLKKDIDTELQRLLNSDEIDFSVEDASYLHKTVCKMVLENIANYIKINKK